MIYVFTYTGNCVVACSKAVLERRRANPSPCFSPLLTSEWSVKSGYIVTHAFTPSIAADISFINLVGIPK